MLLGKSYLFLDFIIPQVFTEYLCHTAQVFLLTLLHNTGSYKSLFNYSHSLPPLGSYVSSMMNRQDQRKEWLFYLKVRGEENKSEFSFPPPHAPKTSFLP